LTQAKERAAELWLAERYDEARAYAARWASLGDEVQG
jgi:hypothetical protein